MLLLTRTRLVLWFQSCWPVKSSSMIIPTGFVEAEACVLDNMLPIPFQLKVELYNHPSPPGAVFDAAGAGGCGGQRRMHLQSGHCWTTRTHVRSTCKASRVHTCICAVRHDQSGLADSFQTAQLAQKEYAKTWWDSSCWMGKISLLSKLVGHVIVDTLSTGICNERSGVTHSQTF